MSRTPLLLAFAALSGSALGLAPGIAQAQRVMFAPSSFPSGDLSAGRYQTGDAVVQIAAPGGAGTISFTAQSSFSVEADGSIVVESGSFTATTEEGGPAMALRTAKGVALGISGGGGSGSFQIAPDGGVGGWRLNGTLSVTGSNGAALTVRQRGFAVEPGGSPAPRAYVGPMPTASAPAYVTPASQQQGRGQYLANASLTGIAAGQAGVPVTTNPQLPVYQPLDSGDLLAQTLALRSDPAAVNFQGLTEAYLQVYVAFLRAGGVGGQFTDAGAATALSDYLSFLRTGGLPASYTASAQSLLNAYLSYVQSIGVPSGLGDAQSALLSTYLDLLRANGGVPVNFDASAIANAYAQYIQFVAGGGDPARYAALSPALVQAYLDAIGRLGLPEALDASTRAQIEAYQALAGQGVTALSATQVSGLLDDYLEFLKSGQNPGDFAGLSQALLTAYLNYIRAFGLPDGVDPALLSQLTSYQQLLANGLGQVSTAGAANALSAFIQHLQNGGTLETYSTLSEATLRAYLSYLQSLGLPQGLDADTLARLQAYFSFLAEGGQFGTVPVVTPPPPPPPPTPVVVTSADLTIRSAVGGTASIRSAESNIGAGQLLSVGIDNAGVARGFGDRPQFIFSGDASDVQSSTTSGSEWRIGRLSNGTYSNGAFTSSYSTNEAVFYGIATSQPTVVPSSGTATFGLRAFTSPAYSDGSVVSDATLYGGIAIRFGASPLFGIEGSLLLQDDGVARRYDFASNGGLANPSMIVSNRNGVRALDANAPVVTTDTRCANSSCRFTTGLALGGAGANLLAGVYGLFTNSGNRILAGAAVYEDGATVTTAPSVATPPPTGSGSFTRVTAPETYHTQLMIAQASPRLEGFFGGNDFDMTFGDNGVPSNFGGTNAISAESSEVAGNQYVNIGRFHSGTIDVGANQVSLTTNHGSHYMVLRPISTLPASGVADYALLFATRPTYANASTAPGIFDGRMRLAFGATPRIALMGTITMPDSTYSFGSQARMDGVATSGATFTGTRILEFVREPMSSTGSECATGQCDLLIRGALTGPDAAYAGLAYFSNLPSGNRLLGTAIFYSGEPGTHEGGVLGANTPPPPPAGTFSPVARTSTPFGFVAVMRSAGATLPTLVGSTTTHGLDLVLDDAGLPITLGDDHPIVNATLTDIAGNQWVNIGRFVSGRYRSFDQTFNIGLNQGVPWLRIALTPRAARPATGTALYDLAFATKPSFATGVFAAGEFDAKLAVAFGLDLKVAVFGTLTMPEAGSPVTYSFGSQSKLDNVATQGLDVTETEMRFIETLQGSGRLSCATGSCRIAFLGGLAGEKGEYAGLSYVASNPANDGERIVGTAILHNATASTLSGGRLDDRPITGPTTRTGQYVAYATDAYGIDQRTAEIVVSADGTLRSYNASAQEQLAVGSNRAEGGDVKNGDATSLIGWTRWSGGQTDGIYFSRGNVTRSSNQGMHLIHAEKATNVPTSGTATYALVGATSPTMRDGSVTPGTLTGTASVSFAALPTVGVDLTVNLGGSSYGISTSGNTMSTNSNFAFFGNSVAVTGSGAACSGTQSCTAAIRGTLAGSGASHMGFSYTFGSGLTGKQVDGAAVFGKQ